VTRISFKMGSVRSAKNATSANPLSFGSNDLTSCVTPLVVVQSTYFWSEGSCGKLYATKTIVGLLGSMSTLPYVGEVGSAGCKTISWALKESRTGTASSCCCWSCSICSRAAWALETACCICRLAATAHAKSATMTAVETAREANQRRGFQSPRARRGFGAAKAVPLAAIGAGWDWWAVTSDESACDCKSACTDCSRRFLSDAGGRSGDALPSALGS